MLLRVNACFISRIFRRFCLPKVHESEGIENAVTMQKLWHIQKWSLFRRFYI